MSFFRARRPLVFLALAGAMAIAAAASVSPVQDRIPPAPTRWVTDEAGFLSRQAAAELDARLESYERRTGHQVIVWIGRTLGGNAVLEDWAVKAFEAWKVGRRGLDDGLVLFIFAEDRKIRIEVGYGLEDKVPDIYAFRVIDQILAPGFRAGRVDEAVDAAVTAIMGYISGEDPLPAEGRRDRGRPESSLAGKIFAALAVLVFLFLFITNPSLAFWLLLNILGGGRGGGRGGGGWGGGGGGGFSGGGGRSGGGGASGGW